jgi:hypothetical protein
MTASQDEQLPCLTCRHPKAIEVRHLWGLGALDGENRSPNGLPVNCCRVKIVGVTQPDMAR